MTDGKSCLLEYMKDSKVGKAHLYDIKKTSEWDCHVCEDHCHIEMEDSDGELYKWSRQKHGVGMTVQVTPQTAKAQMQEIMGNDYNMFSNNCHVAQESLRRKWNLTIDKPFGPQRVFRLIVKIIYYVPPFLNCPIG